MPNGDELLALYDEAIARFMAGEPMNPDPALPEGVQMLLQSLETPANLPFARELWTADAASAAQPGGRPDADHHWEEGPPGGLASRWRAASAGSGGT